MPKPKVALAIFHSMSQPTVVSAYYPIPSKFGVEQYIKWIIEFWPKTTFPLIFFTDPLIAGQFEAMFKDRKGPTRVVGIPFHMLHAFTRLSPKMWRHTHQYDPEKETHSPELYAMWYEKKEFVLRAIQLNPFGSDSFVWCDAGICRSPEWMEHLGRFPMRENIPAFKMLVLRIAPFEELADKNGMFGHTNDTVTVGGGILAGSISSWVSWSKTYDAMLMKYYLSDRFIGKDQNIMASVILGNPGLIELVDPPKVMNSIQKWFYLLFYLAGVRIS